MSSPVGVLVSTRLEASVLVRLSLDRLFSSQTRWISKIETRLPPTCRQSLRDLFVGRKPSFNLVYSRKTETVRNQETSGRSGVYLTHSIRNTTILKRRFLLPTLLNRMSTSPYRLGPCYEPEGVRGGSLERCYEYERTLLGIPLGTFPFNQKSNTDDTFTTGSYSSKMTRPGSSLPGFLVDPSFDGEVSNRKTLVQTGRR